MKFNLNIKMISISINKLINIVKLLLNKLIVYFDWSLFLNYLGVEFISYNQFINIC